MSKHLKGISFLPWPIILILSVTQDHTMWSKASITVANQFEGTTGSLLGLPIVVTIGGYAIKDILQK